MSLIEPPRTDSGEDEEGTSLGVAPGRSRSFLGLWKGVQGYLPILSVVVFLIIWHVGSGSINPILLPSPVAVAESFFELLRNGEIIDAFTLSLVDLMIGFAIAAVGGLLIGVLMGRYRTVEAVLQPYVAFFIATPSIAMIPLFIIWFGFGDVARVVVIVTGSIWPIIVNCCAGVKTTDRQLRQLSHAFRLTNRQYMRWVALPHAIPHIVSGFKLGLGQAIVSMIVAQMTMELVGLGGLVMTYGNAFKTGHLLAGVVTASLFGVLITTAMDVIERKFFPWIHGQTSA